MSAIKLKKTATIFIVLPLLVVVGMYLNTKPQKHVLGTGTQVFPEEEQVQEVIVNGEKVAPVGFPYLSVYPTASLIHSTNNGEIQNASWQVNEKLSVVVAWHMYKFYDNGWFMSSLPADPSSENDQEFTAEKDGITAKFKAYSGGNTTYFSIDVIKQ